MGGLPFSGKTAFISGGASGIGQAIAEEFGRRGLRVVVGDIDLAGAERVAAGIDGASAVKLDVRDEAAYSSPAAPGTTRHPSAGRWQPEALSRQPASTFVFAVAPDCAAVFMDAAVFCAATVFD